MNSSKRTATWRCVAICAVLTAALSLRVGVALYNSEANDDHMEVVTLIADEGANPLVGDCWQCCQAKLFHRTAAYALNTSRSSTRTPASKPRSS